MERFGNSAYDEMATDKDRRHDVKYDSDKEASHLVNDKYFRELHPLDNELSNVKLRKKCIEYNLPIQITIFVCQYAELQMLKYQSNCVQHACTSQDTVLCYDLELN